MSFLPRSGSVVKKRRDRFFDPDPRARAAASWRLEELEHGTPTRFRTITERLSRLEHRLGLIEETLTRQGDRRP